MMMMGGKQLVVFGIAPSRLFFQAGGGDGDGKHNQCNFDELMGQEECEEIFHTNHARVLHLLSVYMQDLERQSSSSSSTAIWKPADELAWNKDKVLVQRLDNEGIWPFEQLVYKTNYYLYDNLWYELAAGQYVNTLEEYLPTFVHTYGMLQYDSSRNAPHRDTLGFPNQFSYTKFQRNAANVVMDNVSPWNHEWFANDCAAVDDSRCALILRNIPNFITMHDLMQLRYWEHKNMHPFQHEFDLCMYLTYMSLHAVRNCFTQNDLNLGNMGLYRPFEKGYILVRIARKRTTPSENEEEGDSVVLFEYRTRMLPKILDYGRSVYPGTQQMKEVLQQTPSMNAVPDVDESNVDPTLPKRYCHFFHQWLSEEPWVDTLYNTVNPSQDLKLMWNMQNASRYEYKNHSILSFIRDWNLNEKQIIFGAEQPGQLVAINPFYTTPKLSNPNHCPIQNVSDATAFFRTRMIEHYNWSSRILPHDMEGMLYRDPGRSSQNGKTLPYANLDFQESNCLGVLTIYEQPLCTDEDLHSAVPMTFVLLNNKIGNRCTPSTSNVVRRPRRELRKS